MKKRFYLVGLLSVVLSVSCSDEITDDRTDPNGGKGEIGYVKVSINLPSVSGNTVKANENGNDNFDDGLAEEYKVNDIILAIFQGTSEGDATCIEAHKLSSLSGTNVGGNVTVKYPSGIIEITKPETGKKLYALAIVNNAGYFSVNTDKKLQFNGSDFAGNLAGLNSLAQTVDLEKIAKISGDANFLMTNAPVSNEPGQLKTADKSNHAVTTLVPLKVYATRTAAEADEANADQIYVERAVAKVTASVSGTDNKLIINSPTSLYHNATVEFKGWKLNLTNKKYYPVRNVSDWSTWDNYYVNNEVNRFFGYEVNPYRVYWAIDPNYTTTSDADLNKLTVVDNWNTMGSNEYCAENTTTANDMKQSNLTGVLLETTFTLNGGTSGDNLFLMGDASTIYVESLFITRATNALTGDNALASGLTLKVKSGAVAATVSDKEGLKAVIGISDDSDLSDGQANAILNDAGGKIKFYKGGVMYYYTSVIKHFGNNPTEYTGDVNNPSYDEDKHLGRYGVVRNNWYELSIKSVSGPGEPSIPTVPDEPVDKEHSYINAQINILSWAKRTQDVDL